MQENKTTVELRTRAVAAETALAEQKKDLLLHKKKVSQSLSLVFVPYTGKMMVT